MLEETVSVTLFRVMTEFNPIAEAGYMPPVAEGYKNSVLVKASLSVKYNLKHFSSLKLTEIVSVA